MDQVIDTAPMWGRAPDDTAQPQQPLALPLPTGGAPAAAASTPAQSPQGVLNTTGAQPQAEAPFDDDADIQKWDATLGESLRRTLSHRGDFRPIESEVPEWQSFLAKDPRVQNIQMAEEAMAMLSPKDQIRAAKDIKSLKTRLEMDAQRARAAAVLAAKEAARNSIKDADYSDKSPEAIERRMTGVQTATQTYTSEMDKLIDSGDPQKRQQGELGKMVNARDLLSEKIYNPLVATMAARNGMDPLTAVYAVQSLTTPIYGETGFNQMKGRAATAFRVLGTDAVGNPIVQFRDGRRAIVPEQYFNAIETARRRGYDLLKQRADEIRKERAAGPGWFGRQVQGVTEWARGLQ